VDGHVLTVIYLFLVRGGGGGGGGERLYERKTCVAMSNSQARYARQCLTKISSEVE